MKKIIPFLVFLVLYNSASAVHIKGGWIYYEYLGKGINDTTKFRYNITLKVYRDCGVTNPGQNDDPMQLTVFKGLSNTIYTNLTIPLDRIDTMDKKEYSPCLTTHPPVCYRILVYTQEIEVPKDLDGYTLSYQRCCRVQGILNVVSPSDDYGDTYSTTIPGTSVDSSFMFNNSPVFAQKDTALICHNSYFSLDYSAVDIDGDSLVYYYSRAINGGTKTNPTPQPSNAPTTFSSIPYASGYSASNPFGTNVNLNTATGLIDGISPSATGEYVLSVSVDEYRHGQKIGNTRKELHVIVADCALSAAALKPSYITCDGFTLHFQNESSASNIIGYHWDFGIKNSNIDTSTSATPTFTYIDTGKYTLKLMVDGIGGCSDSAKAIVKVYPGFIPNFYAVGSCYSNPFYFHDSTVSKYGIVDGWRWDFGDSTTTADTSRIKNPLYTYPSLGTRKVIFYVADNKGCSDTVKKWITVSDKPLLIVPSRDTALCDNDSVQLMVQSEAGVSYNWSPTNNIINGNTATPIVFPKDTTYYYVDVVSNGCKNRDSVKVRVYKFITVDAGPDSAMCLTDTMVIKPVSVATNYIWTPTTGIIGSSNVKNPVISPTVATLYMVSANLGRCPDKDSVWIKPYPYPTNSVSADDTICFGKKIQLSASFTGNKYAWSPTSSLFNPNSLTPTAGPSASTTYLFTASYDTGCLKPISKSIYIKVRDQVIVDAGKDTSILEYQPFRIGAIATPIADSLTFLWKPSLGLDSVTNLRPVVNIPDFVDSITYRLTATNKYGCYGQDDIKIVVIKSGPDILVPSAFTPNGDGLNDIIRPITIGLTSLDFFNVYNRWGQLLYSTKELKKGWDGIYNGTLQPSGTYIYQTQGTDFLGKIVYRKGTFVLIR